MLLKIKLSPWGVVNEKRTRGENGRGSVAKWALTGRASSPTLFPPPPTPGFRCCSREARGSRLPPECSMPEREQRLPHPNVDPAQRHPWQRHHQLLH